MSTAAAALLLTETNLAEALNDQTLAARVVVRNNPRARRVSLRVDAIKGCVVLVRPPRVGDKAVANFVASREPWITKHLALLPERIAFADGAIIPYRGQEHVVHFRRDGRGRPPAEEPFAARGCVWREDGTKLPTIIVAGRPEHAARRLRDWLKAEARRLLTLPVYAMAAVLDLKIPRVTVRDTRSRWGSCSRDGRLAFSWRLILAPAPVLTYVAAHEVAHLVHMNHGPEFWRTVARLLEDVGAESEEAGMDRASAREWLRRRGAALHRYG